jgi:hypothetical protein
LVESLTKYFISINGPKEAQAELVRRKQGDSEAYYQDLIILCRLVNEGMRDDEKINIILEGLNKATFLKVYTMDNGTLEKLLSNVKRVERTLRIGGEDSTAMGLLKNNNEVVGKLCDAVTKLAAKCEEGNVQKLYQTTSGEGDQERERGHRPIEVVSGRGRSRGFYRGRGQVGRNRYDRYGRLSRTADGRVICYNCHCPGQYSSNCPRRQPENKNNKNPGSSQNH